MNAWIQGAPAEDFPDLHIATAGWPCWFQVGSVAVTVTINNT